MPERILCSKAVGCCEQTRVVPAYLADIMANSVVKNSIVGYILTKLWFI